jgi:hypothetical protein
MVKSTTIERIMRMYHSSLNHSLKLRKILEGLPKDSDRYDSLHRRLMDVEVACQDLDEKLYKAVNTYKIENEYFNHLKK